uniref:Uncharacterized protein n=1 Tax=Avena sativa TaxID=4498 RepID=A0ACD5ZND8_AVESA
MGPATGRMKSGIQASPPIRLLGRGRPPSLQPPVRLRHAVVSQSPPPAAPRHRRRHECSGSEGRGDGGGGLPLHRRGSAPQIHASYPVRRPREVRRCQERSQEHLAQRRRVSGVPDWRNFDDDDSSDSPYGTFGGKASFTWYWPGEDDDLGSTPSGFQWRDEPRSTKSKGRVWNESDVDEEDEPCRDDLKTHRISLGLPDSGPLKLDHIKSAFRASALKWHPDKHQGSSQPEAEEKFRRCIEAYSALAGAFKSSK